MAALQGSSNAVDKNARKRRAHRKSRSGCANCKLRRVKVRHILALLREFTYSSGRPSVTKDFRSAGDACHSASIAIMIQEYPTFSLDMP